jgi:hypothetical protein
MLKNMAVVGLGAALPRFALGQSAPKADWRATVLKYLASLARPDGGYAWEDQEQSHLTPTFAVIGCYRLLQQAPPRREALAQFVRTHHPGQLKKLEQEHREFEYQQIQSLLWLGEDAAAFRDQVASWKKPTVYLKQYEQHGWPILRHEVTAFLCRTLLGLPLDDLSPDYIEYLNSRRRANGSFNNTPTTDGGDGHVLNTWWGLQALQVLGRLEEKKAETIDWLRACQLPGGGFTWQPKPEFAGVEDVAYTRAALRALQLLGAAPANRATCTQYLRSLANADGGFGDRPGWLSNPVATYYALDALGVLGELDSLASVRRNPRPRTAALPANLKLYSIQIEAHGKGSPAEAVDLARALRIHLWGAKNASPQWLARAQALADQQKVPVKFFVANEEYDTWVRVPGLGTYSHTSDIIAPPNCDFGPALARQGALSWPEFRERRLAPLQKARGHLIWQFGENEELVRLYLDDSLERGGYAAISTFHFGNPDFTTSEPFLQRYRGRLPFIALQDSHGDEAWWFADKTTGFRTVFLAAEPTWEGWLTALEHNWVAAIRHDAASGFKTWMHAGSPEVLEFVRQHETEWRWWDNPLIQRPLVSLVALTPKDAFEAARPEQGLTLRVRCAWECAAQGQLKQPMAELVKLTLDGVEVSPKLVTRRGPRGAMLVDQYHEFHLPTPAPGKHTAGARIRVVETGAEASRDLEFVW